MNAAIQSICYNISKRPELRNSPLKRSQLHEVIAAMLGYSSHAALVQENKNLQLTDFEFSDAEFIVLNVPQGVDRAQKIGLSVDIVNTCILEVKKGLPVPVFESLQDFYDEHLNEFFEKFIYDVACESGEMANSNAAFDTYPDMDQNFSISSDFWTALQEWSIEDTGTLTGSYDPEGDRMYNGHMFNVKGKLTFAKAGRAGLIFLDDSSDCFLSSDDSWRDYEPYEIED